MNQLDDIKERWEEAKPPHGPSDAVRAAAQDVPALVAAVEAVLSIPFIPADCNGYLSHKRIGYNSSLSEVHAAIREALGEKQ